MAITKASSNAVAPAAKGDLVVGNATNDSNVLSVGANGTTLVADSAEATGLKWATASSGGMTLLSTTTLSGASTTVTISDFSYNYLKIFAYNATWSGSGNLAIKPNNSTTICASSFTYWTSGTSGSGGTKGSYMQLGLNTNNGTNSAVVDIYNYASTGTYKPFIVTSGSLDSSSEGQAWLNQGAIITNSQISSLVFIQNSSVNMSGGTVLVYGVK